MVYHDLDICIPRFNMFSMMVSVFYICVYQVSKIWAVVYHELDMAIPWPIELFTMNWQCVYHDMGKCLP